MADVVHRITGEVRLRVNTPDYDPTEWLIHPPGLASLVGRGTLQRPEVPRRHWVIDGDELREALPLEKQATDQGQPRLEIARQDQRLLFLEQSDEFLQNHYDIATRLHLLTLREGSRRNHPALLLYFEWYERLLSSVARELQRIASAPDLAAVQTPFDFADLDQSDPRVTLETLFDKR